jgi:hypothetical protein
MGRAFRHRNYRLFFAGQSLPASLCRPVFAGQLPLLLLSPLAGVLAGRHRLEFLHAQRCPTDWPGGGRLAGGGIRRGPVYCS